MRRGRPPPLSPAASAIVGRDDAADHYGDQVAMEYAKQCMNIRVGNARYSAMSGRHAGVTEGVQRDWPMIRVRHARMRRIVAAVQLGVPCDGLWCACLFADFSQDALERRLQPVSGLSQDLAVAAPPKADPVQPIPQHRQPQPTFRAE
jgi:hypothetical protein